MKKQAAIFVVLLLLALKAVALPFYQLSPPVFVGWPAGSNFVAANIVRSFQPNQIHFDEDKVWLYGATKGIACILYDLKGKKPLGYITNGTPFAALGNYIFCEQYHCIQKSPWSPWLQSAVKKWDQLSQSSYQLPLPKNRYWALDLGQNRAINLGQTTNMYSPSCDTFEPSLDFQCGFIARRTGSVCADVFDLGSRRIWNWNASGLPLGWWDNTHVLFCTASNDIALCEPRSGRTSILVEWSRFTQFFREHPDCGSVDSLRVVCHWDGKVNHFFMVDANKTVGDSFLMEITRPSGHLKLREPHFHFELNGRLDPSGEYYVYNAESFERYNTPGLYLIHGLLSRELKTGKIATIVPAKDLMGAPSFQFHHREVFYIFEQTLWKASLDGTHHEQIFPPL